MTLPELLAAWHDHARSFLPAGTDVWDAHTHTGDQDPDGVVGRADELVQALADAGQAGAVVSSNHNPAGYRHANDRVLREAGEANGRIIPFLRVDPNDPDAPAETERSLAAGHRGIKLHPRAEQFLLDHAALLTIGKIAAEHGAPLLFHAGRGIPSLGDGAVQLVDKVEGLNVILAHCAISDLAYLGPIASDHPGVFFDTSWWNVTDILALMSWVPPQHIVYASDTPYGHPRMSFTITMRPAVAAGYTAAQLRGLFGATLLGLLEGRRPADRDAAPGDVFPHTAGMLRVHSNIHGAVVRLFSDQDPAQPLALARQACQVNPRGRHGDVYHTIGATLAAVEAALDDPTARRSILGVLLAASAASLTPSVGVPPELR